ncbi:hypothetical protein LF41_604 [Lysobacter dokdonensis DS-58]|uniref:Serine/threonine protein kinase n=1 Tax=Lysobacter dokdonensis DS-58 TaxID=1300345 RepID=A0A0A2WFQ1_9GAMM|nr:hypothetical protein [Lysobacter dokdonensis]KGQ18578.1 hypothetical protein LF41_604 [Lysobacter dokdonensis DS-58]
MELHELESAWKTLDARVARQDVELAQLRARDFASRMKATLLRVTLGQWWQIAVGLAFAVWGGSYWFDHLGTTHLVAYGLAVHAYGIALLATAIVLLVHLSRVDYGQSVADVQQRVLELRRTRIRCERVLWIAGAVMWVPILMIALRFIRVDAWAANPWYVLGNLAVGLVLAAVAGLLMWRKPAWFAKHAMDGGLAEVERRLADVQALRS